MMEHSHIPSAPGPIPQAPYMASALATLVNMCDPPVSNIATGWLLAITFELPIDKGVAEVPGNEMDSSGIRQ